MSNIIYHPEAVAETLAAFEWYRSRSRAAGKAFNDELEIAEQQVALHSERWNRYLHDTRRYHLERYPYALVYMEQDNCIFGVAVAHLHRKPGYWKSRLI